MSRIGVIAKVPAAPGKGNELAAAFEKAIHDHVMGESGTRYYVAHADSKDPDVIWIYEMYDDKAALDAHLGADWFKEFGKQLGGLVGGPPEMHILRPIVGKGL